MAVGRLRFSAIIPIVCSTVACALLIVLVTAGIKPGQNSKYYLLSLNTSEVGTNLVQIKTANNGSSNPITGNGVLGGIIGMIPGLDGAINNLSDDINQGLEQLVDTLIKGATDSIGLKDEYDIYLQNICQGNRADPNNPNSQIIIDSCPNFKVAGDALGSITNVTSYVVVGNTNVSFPFLETLGETGSTTGQALLSATTANAAFIYVGLVVSALIVLTSLASMVLPRIRLLTLGNMLISGLAPGFLLVSAVVSTTVVVVMKTILVSFGNAFTIGAKIGGPAIAVVWVSVALTAVSATYWTLIWFVDARQSVWARFRRPAEQEGNWKETFLASWRNVRIHDDDQKRAEADIGAVERNAGKSTPQGDIGLVDRITGKKSPMGGLLDKDTEKRKV